MISSLHTRSAPCSAARRRRGSELAPKGGRREGGRERECERERESEREVDTEREFLDAEFVVAFRSDISMTFIIIFIFY
jgi:hypothetical protein